MIVEVLGTDDDILSNPGFNEAEEEGIQLFIKLKKFGVGIVGVEEWEISDEIFWCEIFCSSSSPSFSSSLLSSLSKGLGDLPGKYKGTGLGAPACCLDECGNNRLKLENAWNKWIKSIIN